MQTPTGFESHPVPSISEALKQVAVLAGLVGVVVRCRLVTTRVPPKVIALDDLLGGFYAGSAVPIGLLLLLCSLKQEYVVYLNDLHLALAISAIATLWVANRGFRL